MLVVRKISLGLVAFLLLIMSSCTPELQPIEFGVDECVHCKMVISDERYGAELVTKKGKVYKFDSAECLVWYQQDVNAVPESEVFITVVIDYGNPKQLIAANSASYLYSKNLPSPMGMFITAFNDETKAMEMQTIKQGDLINWEKVSELVILRQRPE